MNDITQLICTGFKNKILVTNKFIANFFCLPLLGEKEGGGAPIF